MRLNGERTVPLGFCFHLCCYSEVWLWLLIFTSLYLFLPIVRWGVIKMMVFLQKIFGLKDSRGKLLLSLLYWTSFFLSLSSFLLYFFFPYLPCLAFSSLPFPFPFPISSLSHFPLSYPNPFPSFCLHFSPLFLLFSLLSFPFCPFSLLLQFLTLNL